MGFSQPQRNEGTTMTKFSEKITPRGVGHILVPHVFPYFTYLIKIMKENS